MSNMGYCRFENTARDLADCVEHLDNANDLSESEKRALRWMIRLAHDIVNWNKETEWFLYD